jgi:hypothetical protein
MRIMNSLQNEEMEYRRALFKAAGSGDLRAQQELEREYHVRVRGQNERRHGTKDSDRKLFE